MDARDDATCIYVIKRVKLPPLDRDPMLLDAFHRDVISIVITP